MATRGDIRDAFYGTLTNAAGTYDVTDSTGTVIDTVTLDAADMGLRDPEQTEAFPTVVYHEDYRRVQYNDAGSGPDVRTYDANNDVDAEVWREYIEAQFIIDVRASNETYKEPLYEGIRNEFGKYEYRPWPVTNLHPDIIEIDVLDSTSVDTGDTENVIRGDQIEVRLTFYRDFSFSTDNIDSVETLIDADDDGTTDDSYTTT